MSRKQTPSEKLEKKPEHLYKPSLLELGLTGMAEAINKHALMIDNDVFRTITKHLQTHFINDVLFGTSKGDINDPYFRGFLDGLAAYEKFIHERAEVERNPQLK